ncbi:phosphoenolpyruvate carboxylase [Erythrobacter litoralis]|uniref:Phosphoenolpyruvate carboxylase n=1 Tax=Erythrobacter litoralis (strain HTCC2594) TaxID=314225 RepID=Q2NDP4_ERYLH|nr:phosphoenolpyruvate carboxylase [Erythrobacter litoralis]ABC62197.1 Putative phosphoenolpyruvate carboxylase [Erythrobacter litoralis HTCC2594]
MKSVTDLRERLQDMHSRTAETPLFNPVFQLSLDLSRALEAGELSLDDLESMICELETTALEDRAARTRRLLALPGTDTWRLGPDFADFGAFREHWEQPRLHAVFTAHPTFLLTPDQASSLASAITGDGSVADAACTATEDRPAVTLVYEHQRAMRAIGHAQDARDRIVGELLSNAAVSFADRWRDLKPLPFRFATWVGYDMDGRTDIKWYDSIGFRLAEKAQRLRRYVAKLEKIDSGHKLLGTLHPALAYAEARAEDFAQDLSDPVDLSDAANRLTADHEHKLLSLAPIIAALEEEAQQASEDHAIKLLTLAAAMRADGLGMGWIHFRVNAKQLHNAIRRRIEGGDTLEIGSKGAMAVLRKMVAEVEPMRANFGALAIEASTAIRQFLAMAQILHHIDADAPIRMLVAECEQPSTVMAALYFAKLFGIADKVDVSPLFETEAALEHGGRFLDALLQEDEYRAYARNRGRVCIQTGFSDAGRFVGQVPASLAIERLQGRMADAMRANAMSDVAALVFNTHGESMGRGAHPASLKDRLEWPLSPWARGRFARGSVRLEPEASFQGGDGYQLFETPELAFATLAHIADYEWTEHASGEPDPFYTRTDLSLDFYRAIRTHQREHLESQTYSRAITAFGLGMLNSTGSRVSRRQSDVAADRSMNLRQIRAIPHNAILQQLGYPVNVIAGIGTAAEGNEEEIAQLLESSPRGQQLMRLARNANALASIKTVAAYGELFNSAYWASRTYRGTEDGISHACQALADYLTKDDRNGVFRRLASRLRVDALKFHRLLEHLPAEDPLPEREQTRRTLGVLQALRLALFKHMFLRAVSLPSFSRANDISRDDVLEMVFTLRIDDALAQMRRAFPTSFPQLDDFQMDEPSDWPDDEGEGYGAIGRNYIDPLERAYMLSLRVTTAIANHFGAHG